VKYSLQRRIVEHTTRGNRTYMPRDLSGLTQARPKLWEAAGFGLKGQWQQN